MPVLVDETEVGTMTTARRILTFTLMSFWDETTPTPSSKSHAVFNYEHVYLDEFGKQISPAKSDGQIPLNPAELAALPGATEVLTWISENGHALADARDLAAEIPVPEGGDPIPDPEETPVVRSPEEAARFAVIINRKKF